MGHQDLWEAIFQLRQDAGALLKFVSTPSHMRVEENDKADARVPDAHLGQQLRRGWGHFPPSSPHPRVRSQCSLQERGFFDVHQRELDVG